MKQELFGSLFLVVLFSVTVFGQDQDKYIIGSEKKLEMIVHIMGEVRKPGEYRVEDSTNLVELISKAGGPTQYSNLGGVRITRIGLMSSASNGGNGKSDRSAMPNYQVGKRILKININDYLNNENYRDRVPTLRPGDVVFVPRNAWFRWRNVVSVARDLSVIASVYFIYLRATKE